MTYTIETIERTDGFIWVLTCNGKRLGSYDCPREALEHQDACQQQDAFWSANEPTVAERSHAYTYGYDTFDR